MLDISLEKILKLLSYIILIGLPFYYLLRNYFPISSYIYTLFLVPLFLCSGILNTKQSLKNPDIFFILEILILTNIFLLFIMMGYADRAIILLFVTLLISKSFFLPLSEYNFSHAANAIVVSSLVGSIGVILGLIELNFGNTQILYQVMDLTRG